MQSGEARSPPPGQEYAERVATCLHIAHRGYRTGFGDNTLEQLREAIRLGADMIEVDVRRRDRKSTRLNSSHT